MTHLEAHNAIESLKARIVELEAELLRWKTPKYEVYPPPDQPLIVPAPPILLDMQNAYDYPTPQPLELFDEHARERPGLRTQRAILKENPVHFVETLLALEKEHLKAQAQAAEGIERARIQANVKTASVEDDGADLGTAKSLEVIEELFASFEGAK